MTREAERVELRCPSCGAPLPAVAAERVIVCGQCKTASAPAPKAAERVVQTVVVERVVVAGDHSVTPCPRCRVGLFGVRAGVVDVHGCGICGGIWLDNAGSRAITQRNDPQIVALAARAERNAVVGGARTEPIDCPICNQRMKSVNARVAELDVCEEHGTWFDPGELRRIVAAYHPIHDDPLAPIAGRRDPVEAELAYVAESNRAAPPVWAFEDGTTSGKVAGVAVEMLAGVVGAMLTPNKPVR